MKTKRIHHDCVLIEDSGNLTVYVAGGEDDRKDDDGTYRYMDYLDSIESLKLIKTDINQNEWKLETTVLPTQLAHFQMVESNDKNILFYVVGGGIGINGKSDYQGKIYGLTKLKKWKEMGSLRVERHDHQTINVPLSSLKGCQ